MTTPQQSSLYWTGGAFHTGLMTEEGQFAEAVLRDAIKFLDEYRDACQLQFMAFNGVCNGRTLAYERFKSSFDPTNMETHFLLALPFPIPGSLLEPLRLRQ